MLRVSTVNNDMVTSDMDAFKLENEGWLCRL